MEKKVSWSELPLDILDLILGNLSFADHVRFGAVCTSWRSVAVITRHHRALGFPWMIRRDPPPKPFFMASSLAEEADKVYPLDFPGHLSRKSVRCLGSSHGWLVVADEKEVCYLLNPFSRQHIRLPRRILALPLIYTFKKATLSKAPTPYNISSGTCIIVAIYNRASLAYCRPAVDKAWIPFGKEGNWYFDITFHAGILYAVIYNFNVVIFKINLHRGTMEFASMYSPKIDYAMLMEVHFNVGVFLAGPSTGKLFMVKRNHGVDRSSKRHFKVFELQRHGSEWVQLKCLEDHMLFLGGNCLRSYELTENSSTSAGFSAGCIYFIEEFVVDGDEYPCGIFCLEDESCQPMFVGGQESSDSSHFWLELNDQ